MLSLTQEGTYSLDGVTGGVAAKGSRKVVIPQTDGVKASGVCFRSSKHHRG